MPETPTSPSPRATVGIPVLARQGAVLLTVVALLALSGCRSAGAIANPEVGATAVERDARSSRLAALADEIGGQRQPPIAAGAPTWLRATLSQVVSDPSSPDSKEVGRAVGAILEGWMAKPSFGVDSAETGLGALASAILLGEEALLATESPAEVAQIDGLVALTRIYAIFDESYFANERGFMQQSFSTMLTMASSQGVLQEEQQMQELLAFINATLLSMPLRHAHATALLLRIAPQDDRVLDAVAHRARRAQENGEVEKSLGYFALVAEYRPKSAIAQADLAQAQLRALDLDDAREQLVVVSDVVTSLDANKDGGEKAAKDAKNANLRLEALKRDLAIGEKIVALGGRKATPATADAAVELCNGLFDIGLLNDAGTCFQGAIARFTDDARFATGLGRVLIARDLDMGGAAAVVDAARGAKHKDRDFYEIYFGAHSSAILLYLLPRIAQDPGGVAPAARQYIEQMRGELAGFEAFAPDRSQTLGALYAGTDHVLSRMSVTPEATISLLREAAVIVATPLLATRDAHPDSHDAARVALVATRFVGDPKLANAHLAKRVDLPAGEKLDEVLLLRARVARDLGIIGSKVDLIDLALRDVLATTPETRASLPGRRLEAELRALKAMLERKGAAEALAQLEALVQAGGGSPSVSVSIAVLRAETGDLAGATKLLEELRESAGEERDVIELNLLRLADPKESMLKLESFDASTQGVAYQAARTAHFRAASAAPKGKNWPKEQKERLAIELAEGRIAKGASLDLVSLTKGKLDVSVNYSTKDRMDIRAFVDSELWMLVRVDLRAKQ